MDAHRLTLHYWVTKPLLRVGGTLIVATAAVTLLALIGWWWLVPVTGVLIGLLSRSGRISVPVAFLAGLVGYTIALYVEASIAVVSRIARVAASLAGLGNDSGLLVVIATVVHGALLCMVGAWVASIVQQMRRDRVSSESTAARSTSGLLTADTEKDPSARRATLIPIFAASNAAFTRTEPSHD